MKISMGDHIGRLIKAWFTDPLSQKKKSIQHLVSMLSKVTKLSLVNCQIDDPKMLKLAGALKDNQTLQLLEIDNNNLSSLGLRYLMDALKDKPNLTVIVMDLLTGDEMQAQFNILMQYNYRINKVAFIKGSGKTKLKITINENNLSDKKIKSIKEMETRFLPMLPFHRNLPLSPLIGSYLLKPKKILNKDEKKRVESAFKQLVMRHEVLRTQLTKNKNGQWCQKVYPGNPWLTFRYLNLYNLSKSKREVIIKACEQSLLKTLEESHIAMMVVYLERKGVQNLLILFNHHHFDFTSQKIFFKELEMALLGELPSCEVSYCKAVTDLHKLAKSDLQNELTFWKAQLEQAQTLTKSFSQTKEIGNSALNKANKSSIIQMRQDLDEASLKIKELLSIAYIQVDEVLLTAWIQVLLRWFKNQKVVVNLISHGRGLLQDEVGILEDIIGCFVTLYPVCFSLPPNSKGKQAVLHIKTLLEKVPHKGYRYGLLRFCLPELTDFWDKLPTSNLFFHFQVTTTNTAGSSQWEIIESHALNALHTPNRLEPIWAWDQQKGKFRCAILYGNSYSSKDIEKLLEQYYQQIIKLVDQLIRSRDSELQTTSLDKVSKEPAPYTAPRNIVEKKLADIWGELLYRDQVGINDNFFLLGGGSLQIIRLVTKIKEVFNQSVSVVECFKCPTIAEQAKFCSPGLLHSTIDPLLPVQVFPDTVPLFLVHPIEGNAFPYLNLSKYLKGYTIYGLNNPRFTEPNNPFESIEEMAAFYLETIKAIQPDGPYHLGGWSFGGTVALEMARQLQAQSHTVNILVLLDTLCYTPLSLDQQSRAENFAKHPNELPEVEKYMIACSRNHWNIQQAYCPKKYPGRVVLIKARDIDEDVVKNIYGGKIPSHLLDIYNGWASLLENIEIYSVPGNHGSLLDAENIEAVANIIKEGFETLEGHPLLNKKLPLAARLFHFASQRKDTYLVHALLKKYPLQFDSRDIENGKAFQ